MTAVQTTWAAEGWGWGEGGKGGGVRLKTGRLGHRSPVFFPRSSQTRDSGYSGGCSAGRLGIHGQCRDWLAWCQ